jgi:hypothetical protein
MAETETAPPLAPEETATETPVVVDKSLQKEQQKRANLERQTNERFDRIEGLLEKLASARTTESKEDRLEAIEKELEGEQGAELEKYNPGISKYLKDIAKEVKASRKAPADDSRVKELESRLEAQEAFNLFMSDKPAEFRKDYAAHQKQLMEEYEDSGDPVTERELRIAMGQFTKQWFKDQETEDEPAKIAPGRKSSIIPSNTGARRKVEDLTPQAAVTRLQKPRPGDGNLLGISREDVTGRR